MNKLFRKTVLAATAVLASLNLSTLSISASSPGNPVISEAWSARHINIYGPTGTDNKYTTSYMKYSTYGVTVYCNAASNTVNGASGMTKINCLNYSMSEKSITNIGSIVCNPNVSGLIENVAYRMSAYTSCSGNIYNCSGNIVVKQTK